MNLSKRRRESERISHKIQQMERWLERLNISKDSVAWIALSHARKEWAVNNFTQAERDLKEASCYGKLRAL